MNISEKVSYLKGLFEGLDIGSESKEHKLFSAIIDVLEEAALTISDLEDEVAELNEIVDELDEDLGALEDDYYELDDEDDCFEAVCPTCGEVVALDDDLLEEGKVVCPECGAEFEFEIEDECCGDEGCCCCGEE